VQHFGHYLHYAWINIKDDAFDFPVVPGTTVKAYRIEYHIGKATGFEFDLDMTSKFRPLDELDLTFPVSEAVLVLPLMQGRHSGLSADNRADKFTQASTHTNQVL